MNRVPYLEPLVNFLKASTTLNNHGIPGVIDLANQNIYVYSEWTPHKDARNYAALLIIEPGEGENINEKRPDCLNEFEKTFYIRTQVSNKRKTQQHFQENVQAGVTSYEGAYMDAARLEDLVRKTVLQFNAQVADNAGYTPVELKSLQDEISEDGYLVLKQVYTTKIMF